MELSTYIFGIIFDTIFYEFIWYLLKRGTIKMASFRFAFRAMIIIYLILLVIGTNVHTFVNCYFMTLWFFVIYPERIRDELTEPKVEGETHDEIH